MPEDSSLKLVIYPAFDAARFEKIRAAAGRMKVVNAATQRRRCAKSSTPTLCSVS